LIQRLNTVVETRKLEIAPVYNANAEKVIAQAAASEKKIVFASTKGLLDYDMYADDDANNMAGNIPQTVIYGLKDDTTKTEADAKAYLRSRGYTDSAINDTKFIYGKGADGNDLTHEDLSAAISSMTGIPQENIGIRALDKEVALSDSEVLNGIEGVLLEVKYMKVADQVVYKAMNSCQALLKMLIAADGKGLPPGVTDGSVRGLYSYDPIVPIDYGREIADFARYMHIVRTAA